MSIKLLQQFDQAQYQGITPNEKLVLIVLITSAEKGNNFSWARINLIRQRTKIEDPTSIRRTLRSLIRKGWIEEAQEMGKGKLRDGYYIFIPTEKMKTYQEYREQEKIQAVLREEDKLSSHGGYSLSSINSKNRNSKDRNSKKLLASPKDNKEIIFTLPIGLNMNDKKFLKKNENVGKSVEEIVNQKMKEKPIPKKINPLRLFEIWCDACRKKDKTYKGFCNGKTVGNLKYILKHTEGVDINPKHFIETIVGDWYGFGQKAKDMDCKSTSLYPSIPYLTQNLESAILFYGDKQGAQSPSATGGITENNHDFEKHIAGHDPKPKSGSKGHTGGPVISYLTPKEQEKQLEKEMKQFHKDKKAYLKEKNLDR